MKTKEVHASVTGCALTAASSVMLFFFGLMSIGAMAPSFALLGLQFSAVALVAALALLVGQSVFSHLGGGEKTDEKPRREPPEPR